MAEDKEKVVSRSKSNALYTVIASLVVIAIVVAVNVLVRVLPNTYTRFDVNFYDVYKITDATYELLDTIDKDVVIYTIAETGGENEIVETIVGRYTAANSHITHETVNPTQSPDFISNFSINLNEGSLLVVCGDKSRSIDIADMMYTVETSSGDERAMIDVEGQLTAAIAYVTSDSTPIAYVLYDNDTIFNFDDEMLKNIEKQNIECIELTTTNLTEIPEDADMVILYSPTEDISDDLYEVLDAYMATGGNFLYLSYFSYSGGTEYTNVNALLSDYGVSIPEGNVIEGNSEYYADDETPYAIYPILQSHTITQSLIDAEESVEVFISNRIEVEQVEGVTVEKLLTTSYSAYIKDPDDSSMIKTATDISGRFNLGVAVTDENEGSKAVVYASYAIGDLTVSDAVNGANADLLVNSCCWLLDQDIVVSIPAKYYGLSNITYSAAETQRLLVIFVVIIPAVFLVFGLYVWVRRRMK